MDPLTIIAVILSILGLVNELLQLLDNPKYNSLQRMIMFLANKVLNLCIRGSPSQPSNSKRLNFFHSFLFFPFSLFLLKTLPFASNRFYQPKDLERP